MIQDYEQHNRLKSNHSRQNLQSYFRRVHFFGGRNVDVDIRCRSSHPTCRNMIIYVTGRVK